MTNSEPDLTDTHEYGLLHNQLPALLDGASYLRNRRRLERLASAVEYRRAADLLVSRLADEARENNVEFGDIAQAAGITKQAAAQAYKRRHPQP